LLCILADSLLSATLFQAVCQDAVSVIRRAEQLHAGAGCVLRLQAAKDVVLANKPIITDDSATLEPALLKTLMEQISTLASVYHKPADTFVSRQRLAVQTVDTVGGRPFEDEDATSAAAAAQVRLRGAIAFVCKTCGTYIHASLALYA
jgi:hypothetical protein